MWPSARVQATQACEEFGHVREIVKFPQAVLSNLPTPVEADDRKKWGLQAGSNSNEQTIQLLYWRQYAIHEYSLSRMMQFWCGM
jgi:hypothetical protein